MGEVAQLNTIEQNALISVIERVATSPDADIAKLEKMLDLQERVMNRQAKEAFAADIALMQTELPRVARNGKGHNDKTYALLEDINDAIRPSLKKYGFAVNFRIKQNGTDSVTVTAILSHKSGHTEETDMMLPLDTTGSKNKVQAVGSTVSYGKRYTLCALLNISTGDDTDGMGVTLEGVDEIRACTSGQQLLDVFTKHYKAAGKNKEQKAALVAAKDEMKAVLNAAN